MCLLDKKLVWLLKVMFVLSDKIQAAQSDDTWLMPLLRYAYDLDE